jgi:hypothetical protein
MAFNALRLRCAGVSLRLRAAAPNFPMSEESITKGMVPFFYTPRQVQSFFA